MNNLVKIFNLFINAFINLYSILNISLKCSEHKVAYIPPTVISAFFDFMAYALTCVT